MNRKPENDKYLQIPERCRLEEKIKGSRFIASAIPVTGDEEASRFVYEIKKEFHDATHNCWAWKVGMGRSQKYRYNDDGEPSGTAGQPILKAIDNMNMTNICVVVTRYFGGTKLGTGGLMRAYGQATLGLLRSCEPVKKYAADQLEFSVDYDFANVAHVIIESFAAELEDSHYGEKATFQVEVRSSKLSKFKEKLTEATNGQVEFK
jgi:uncharacterized YigZ family protein